MFKYIFVLAGFLSLCAEPSIVFVHLGDELPNYLPISIDQARLFNPDCPIYLVANELALKNTSTELSKSGTICVRVESLQTEMFHEHFRRMTRLDRHFRGGFWLFATERFFYLYELMKKYELEDVFHLEYDNMLYADLNHLLPVFHKHYSGKMGGTFDHDNRCIAGFLYVSSEMPLKKFLEFIVKDARGQKNDMDFLASFKNVEDGAYIDHLPIIGPSYAYDHELKSEHNHRVSHPRLYFNHFDEFRSVFDAAALGQYLGGEDPRNGQKGPGFINESCVFNPSFFRIEWECDELERLVPLIFYKGERWPINNLHIHCKKLELFYSRRDGK